jgi:hypothetical protein
MNRKIEEILIHTLALAGILLITGRDVKADYTFGAPTNLGPTVNSPLHEGSFWISSNELELYFDSERPGGHGSWDIWFTSRLSKNADWDPPVNLGPNINSPHMEGGVVVSPDSLELYFAVLNKPGGYGSIDIWVSTRAKKTDAWGSSVNLGPTVNSPADEVCYGISSDGLELYFADGFIVNPRPGGQGGRDIWLTKRTTVSDPWGAPVNLEPTVNTSAVEYAPFISANGLTLLLTSNGGPGSGIGDDIWITTRSSLLGTWQVPVPLGPPVNSTSWVDAVPRLSVDNLTLYFNSDRPGSRMQDIWQVSIKPIVDFNTDGIVDLVDLVMLIDNWETDDSVFDIGPMPWGDGVVDVEDLKVFISHWEN